MLIRLLVFALIGSLSTLAEKRVKEEKISPIDRMIRDSESRHAEPRAGGPAMGSIYSTGSTLADAYRDLRASRIDDIVTIVVADKASAISKGTSASARKSSASGGVKSVFGRSIGPLTDMVGLSGETQLDAQGSTGRESALTTTLTARVTQVLSSGAMVIEGDKEVAVNSERQWVHVRGVIRTFDVSTANTVRSDRIANLEIRVNGKGLVGDAIRRPNILYRILTGILPF
jgi:flagellar L-ring protein FlgH